MHKVTKLLAGLAALCMVSFAHAANNAAFDAFMAQTVGNKTTISFSSTGTPLVTSSAPLGTPSVGAMGITQTAEGVFLESLGSTRVPGTTSTVPVSTKLKLSGAAIAKGLVKGAAAAAGVSTIWSAGKDLYDIWGDLGYRANVNGSIDKATSTTQQGYAVNGDSSTLAYSRQDAANKWCIRPSMYPAYWTGVAYVRNGNGVNDPNGNYVWCQRTNGQLDGWYSVAASGSPQTVTTYSPQTAQQIEDEISQRSGWPTRAQVALRDSLSFPQVQNEVAPVIQAQPATAYEVKVAGATSATIGEPKVTTTTTATDTTTSTETTTASVTNNTITYNTNTVNNTTNLTTGAVTTSTVNTAQAAPTKTQSPLDETGTPTADNVEPNLVADGVFELTKTCLQNVSSCLPSFPSLSWSFSLPTTCVPIPISGFGDHLTEVNICQFQSMFHDLMSMLWVAAGLFAAVGMVSRDAAGGA